MAMRQQVLVERALNCVCYSAVRLNCSLGLDYWMTWSAMCTSCYPAEFASIFLGDLDEESERRRASALLATKEYPVAVLAIWIPRIVLKG